MTNTLPLPSTSITDEKELRRYLFRLVEQLNNTVSAISSDMGITAANSASDAVRGKKALPQSAKELTEQEAELKALIIKNAKVVEAELDTLTNTFRSTYLAQSDFGTFREAMEAQITQTAQGMETLFETYSQVVDRYISVTNGYIRQGIVGYEGITPIIGIAIGQDITVTGAKVTVDGIEYEVIDTSHNMSIWTADKLSFFVNGTEVAYFANDSLHVNRVSVGDWQIDESNGLVIRWKGGEE